MYRAQLNQLRSVLPLPTGTARIFQITTDGKLVERAFTDTWQLDRIRAGSVSDPQCWR